MERPGYCVAYAKPLLCKCKDSDIYFYYEVLLVVFTRFANCEQDPLVDFYSCKCSEWPCWFQFPRRCLRVNRDYPNLRVAFSSGFADAQFLYSWEKNDYVQLFVWTPHLSPPGIYAVYETARSSRLSRDLLGLRGWVYYVYHRWWNGDPMIAMDLRMLRRHVHYELFREV